MEAQSYQQDAARPPRALWAMFAGAMISNVLLIALPVAMAVNSDHTYRAITADQPGLDQANLDVAFYAVLTFAFVLHGVFVVFNTWFGIKALRGRRWARTALSVYLVFAAVGGLFSAAAVPDFLWLVIVSDAVHVVMLFLLWVPAPTRGYFAVHRRPRPDTTLNRARRVGVGSRRARFFWVGRWKVRLACHRVQRRRAKPGYARIENCPIRPSMAVFPRS